MSYTPIYTENDMRLAVQELEADLADMTAERDAVLVDAERYQHFRDNCSPTLLLTGEIKCSITFAGDAWISDGTPELFKKSVDACFDAAITAQKGG